MKLRAHCGIRAEKQEQFKKYFRIFLNLKNIVNLLLVVGLFAWLWPTKPPIASQALVNEQGRDVLRLTCASCPDGTVMTVEGASATVAANVADVLLPKAKLNHWE